MDKGKHHSPRNSSKSSKLIKRAGKAGAGFVVVAIVILCLSILQIRVATVVHTDHSKHKERLHNRTLITFKHQYNRSRAAAARRTNVTKIAYVVSITSCPPGDDNGIIQEAAVLAHNIKVLCTRNHATSPYSFRLIAFVTPEAKRCGMIAAAYGWKILWKEIPFQLVDLDGNTREAMKVRRKDVHLMGNIGLNEYIKLHTHAMTDFPLVVHLDLDTILMKPLDRLFDHMLQRATNSSTERLETIPRDANLPKIVDFFYTRDYSLNGTLTRDRMKRNVQGAFFIVRPNVTTYVDMIHVLKNAEFSLSGGWGNKKYGAGDPAALSVPGFLSYYYGEHQAATAVELNPCMYNTHGYDLRYYEDGVTCKTGEASCDDCSTTPVDQVVSAHFASMCAAPWKCPKYLGQEGERPLCKELHKEWHTMREKFDRHWGHKVVPERGGWARNVTLGYCQGTGRRSYMSVPVPHALQKMKD